MVTRKPKAPSMKSYRSKGGQETASRRAAKERWRVRRITNELRDSIKRLPDALLRPVTEEQSREVSKARKGEERRRKRRRDGER